MRCTGGFLPSSVIFLVSTRYLIQHDVPLGCIVPFWLIPVYICNAEKGSLPELLSLYELNPKIWEIRRQEVILRFPPNESYGLRREIPDWLLKEGSKGGSIVLAKKPLEEFLGISFKKGWWHLFVR